MTSDAENGDAPAEDRRDSDKLAPVLQFVTYKISRVHNRLNSQTAKILQELSDITVVRWRIVAMIGSVGQIRMSELAQMSAFDKGMLSRNMKALIEEGVVSARAVRTDRRTQALSLTPRGQAIYAATLPALIKRNEALIAGISDEDMTTFLKVLEQLDFAAGD